MAGIFEDIQFQKTDLNTVKELKEDCWRKAQGEDLEAFLGFYLKKKPARGWHIAACAALFVFLISAGELGFERLCKNDPSYNPVPMTIGVIAGGLLYLFFACMRQIQSRRELLRIKSSVYVTDAIAYGGGGNVQVMVNHKRIAFDMYAFDETVSPTEQVHKPDGTYEGFRVLLYAVIQDNSCRMKAVLGSAGVRYYASQCRKFEKKSGQVV